MRHAQLINCFYRSFGSAFHRFIRLTCCLNIICKNNRIITECAIYDLPLTLSQRCSRICHHQQPRRQPHARWQSTTFGSLRKSIFAFQHFFEETFKTILERTSLVTSIQHIQRRKNKTRSIDNYQLIKYSRLNSSSAGSVDCGEICCQCWRNSSADIHMNLL